MYVFAALQVFFLGIPLSVSVNQKLSGLVPVGLSRNCFCQCFFVCTNQKLGVLAPQEHSRCFCRCLSLNCHWFFQYFSHSFCHCYSVCCSCHCFSVCCLCRWSFHQLSHQFSQCVCLRPCSFCYRLDRGALLFFLSAALLLFSPSFSALSALFVLSAVYPVGGLGGAL